MSPTDSRGMIVSGQEHHRVHEKVGGRPHHQIPCVSLTTETQETMTLVGDVRDCDCIIVDDITDTGSRLKLAAWTIKRHGANRIFACTTHGWVEGYSMLR